MAKKSWTFQLEDGPHTVELDHGYWSGKKKISIDGELQLFPTNLFDMGGEYPFQINNHKGFVSIHTNGVTYRYDLVVDDRSVQTGNTVKPSLPIPGWGWIFVVACALLPIISRGGAIPSGLGVGGAAGCLYLARDASKSTSNRVLLCIGVTLLVWGLTFVSSFGFFILLRH